jgi:hypothetical protein
MFLAVTPGQSYRRFFFYLWDVFRVTLTGTFLCFATTVREGAAS